ncbi:hypothetical protein ACWGOQ_0023860 [Aquimarina sp. M1]
MAWIYSMWIETESEKQGIAVKDYFNKNTVKANGEEYTIRAYQVGMVTVNGISQIGITSKSDAEEMTSIGFEFYKLLKEAPKYRYALTGVEVDGWREMSELEEDPNDILLISGFVIRKDIYQKLGSPGELCEFNSKYLWTPYEGEKWNQNKKR